MQQLVLDLFPAALKAIRRYTDDDDRVLTVEVHAGDVKLAKPGPASVFDLAVMQVRSVRLASEQRRRHSRVIEKDGGRRLRIMVDERETAEWQEREFQRRARQVVPRPPKAAETKGEKLKQMIGGK